MATALASAQRRYYSLEDMPETNFDCRDKILGGYYADPEANCQMFHVCVKIPGQGVQDFRFLCPNETAFDQENQICADSGDIDCEASGLYLENFDLYRLGSAQAKRPVSTVGNGKGAVLPLGPSTKSPILTNNVYEDDDFYLQRSESGDRRLHSKDLLRGSSSSNFFNNRNKGKDLEEDDEDTQPKRPENNGGNNNNNQFRPRPNSQLRPKTQYQSQFRKAEQQNPTVQTTTQQPAVGNQNQLNDKKRTKIAVRKLTRKRPEDEVDNRSTQQPQEPQTGFSPFSTQVTQKFGVSDTRYSTIKRPTTTPATFAANGETSFKQQTQQGQQQQQQQQNGQNAFGNTQIRQNNFGASNTLQQQQQQQNAQSSFGNTQNRQTSFGATSTQQQQQQNGQNSFLSTQNRQSNFGASNNQQQQQNAQSSFGNVNSQNRQINFGSSNTQQQQFQNSQTNGNVNAQQNRQGNVATGNFQQQQQQQQQQQTQSRFQNFKRTEQTTPAFFEPSPTAGAVSKSSEANTDTTAFSLLRNPIVAAGPGYNANLNRQTTNFQQGRQSTANFASPTPAGVTQTQQQQQNRQSNTETFNYSQQQQQNRQAGANVAAGFSQQRQSGAFQQQQTNGGTFQQTRQQTQQTATSGAGFQQQNRQQTTVTTGNFQQQNKQEVNTGSFQQQGRVQQTQTTAGATQQTQGRQQQNQANNGNFQQGRQQTQSTSGAFQGRQQTQVNTNGNFQVNRQGASNGQTRSQAAQQTFNNFQQNFNSQQGFNGQQTYNSQQSAQVSSGSANGQSRQSNAGATNFQQQSQNSQSNFRNGNTQQQFQQQQNKQSSFGTTNFQQQQQPQQTFNTQVNRQSQRQTFRTYEEFDDGDNQEFLKTAPSNNFRPSDLNSFTNTYKSEEKVNTTRSGEVSTTKYITPTIVTTARTTPAYDTPPQPRQNFFSGQSSTGQPSGFYNPTVSTTQRAVSGVSATSPAPSSKLPQRIYPSPTPAKAAEAAKDTAYDYAYYDDSSATFPDYGGFDHLGDSDFSRTIQRTKSRLI
ncbi:hypothetical protein RUM43_006743 [Polyplax serrata]|uniref:Chitin-binding type-2 domain-containing protein n=1 Tax=Polyplax serrata TaxID=468196 RepID=A0AAN8SA20_POLSC